TGGAWPVSLRLLQIQQTLTILPPFSDSQTFSHSVSDRRRSTSVDTDLNQSTPILHDRRRSSCRQ
ncbi:hypothetical protein KI387_008985, partial [Taxus chinensis]